MLAGLVLFAQAAAAQSVAPDADWRTFDTEHFRITFTPELESLARRAADRAERSYALLGSVLLPPPEGRIELVLTDDFDLSNGMATPFPRNRIVAYAQPPASEPSLAYHDDWLGLLVLHELVHVFHLEHAEGIWPHLRQLFGRDPFLFPQIFSPGWIIEGLATYFESEYTGGGRVRGSTYEMMLRTAILQDDFFSIDRATMDPDSWPGGSTRYVYGSLFIDHLARRFGPSRIGDFLSEIGGRLVPYRYDDAARATFGTTFTEAWRVWEDSLRYHYGTLVDSVAIRGITEPEILTTEGRIAYHPRFAPDGERITYSANTGRDQAALRVISPDGSVGDIFERSSIGPVSWLTGSGGFIHSQLDYAGPYRLFSDMYLTSPTGEADRLTRRARVWEPSPHPEGRRAVVVAHAPGTNVLAMVDLESGAVSPITTPDLDVYWSTPRWSPAGDRIAVARWTAGGLYDIVLLDPAGNVILEVTSDRAVDSAPAWSPDGRYLLFSSDRTGISNLYAFEVDARRLFQVTNVLTGAFQPDVSPDGESIVFSYYQSDGYHVARLPFDPSSWAPAPGAREAVPGPQVLEVRLTAEAGGQVSPYSPWPSLLPARWSAIGTTGSELGTGLGIALNGQDVIERHAWGAQILAYLGDWRWEGGLAYRYRGLGLPVLDLVAEQEWGVQLSVSPDDGGGEEDDLLIRDRAAEAVAAWVFPSWQANHWLDAGIDVRDTEILRRGGPRPDDGSRSYPLDLGVGIGFGYSSVKRYGLSLSSQDGVLGSTRLQARRFLEAPEWDPENRTYWRLTSRARAFRGFDWFGFAPPVLAARLDGGVESGASSAGFRLGGASGESTDADLLGGSIAFPVRGYPAGAQRGNRVLSGSVEYRFPITRIERGFRLLPLSFRRLWGDVFIDSGAAWCGDADACLGDAPDSPDPLLSVGAEAILDLQLGFFTDLPLRAGVAVPLRHTANGVQGYVRVGIGF